jgi:hypothetical protein
MFKTIIFLEAKVRVLDLTWDNVRILLGDKLGDRLGDRLGDNELPVNYRIARGW